jgi:hypothetical protein
MQEVRGMQLVRRNVAVALVLASLSLLLAYSPTDEDQRNGKHYTAVDGPVGDLYRLYFESGHEPADYAFDVFLYLDYVNVPNSQYAHPYIRLMNAYEAGGLWESIPYDYYEYSDIPADSGFPTDPTPGWKVRVSGTSVSVCTGCLTDGGNLDLISLSGGLESVEFVWDPEDTLAAYVRAVYVGAGAQ